MNCITEAAQDNNKNAEMGGHNKVQLQTVACTLKAWNMWECGQLNRASSSTAHNQNDQSVSSNITLACKGMLKTNKLVLDKGDG